MTPERYRRVGLIFAAAADLQEEARQAYLDRECGEDEELRRQVLLLLEADGEDIVVSPQSAESAPEPACREDFSGRTLGRYRIGEKIGEGGMSTVYRAEDTKLDRTVALKFLAPELLRSEQARARFVREAKASASLDDPNICTTYDLEQIEGHSFISMALLEGQTLAQRLKNGPLPIVEAVDIARQAARGLDAAHQKGVVHRDVKPGNLMLLRSGVVKVMDFGVARLENGETLTHSGMTMGTIAYMSPEQIEGAKVDGRSDIWALGAVLYEMLAGRPPFDRAFARETLAAIRGAEPRPILEVRPDTPAALAEMIERCLRKDPVDRLASAGELRERLDEIHAQLITQELTAERPALFPPPASLTRRVLLSALAAVGALGLAWILNQPGVDDAPPAATLVAEKFTSLPGFETEPAISPDGTRIAFAWDGGDSAQTDIYVQLLGSYEPLRITKTAVSERNPVWSPDGTKLAFLRYRADTPRDAQASVMIVPALGGPELRLTDLQANRFRSVLDWSPTSNVIAVSDEGALLLLPADEPQTKDSPPPKKIGEGYSPQFDPAGERIAFTRLQPDGRTQLAVTPIDGGEPRTYSVSNAPYFAWNAAGTALILSRGGPGPLRMLDLEDGATKEIQVAGVRALSTLSVRDNLLAVSESRQNVNIWAVDLGPEGLASRPASKLIASSGVQVSPRFSPSGDRIVFSSDRLGLLAIWLCDRDGKNARLLTNVQGGPAGTPRWSPDGRTIVFDGRMYGLPQIFTVSVDGGKVRQLTDTNRNVVPSWSRDGKWIYYCSIHDSRRSIYKMRPDGSEKTEVRDGPGWEAQESLDGRYLYYSQNRGDVTLYRLDLENGETTAFPEVGNAGAVRFWAPATKGIYFVDTRSEPDWIQFLDIESRKKSRVAPIGAIPEGPGGLALSPDGRTLLYAQRDIFDNDIVLLRDFE